MLWSKKKTCKKCGKKFFFKKNLEKHKKECNKSNKKLENNKYFCIYCDKKFVNQDDLMNHFIDHQGI